MNRSSRQFPAAPHPPEATLLDARLQLLDRQLLDLRGQQLGIVDDLEVAGVEVDADVTGEREKPYVTAILTGNVLFTRIFGGQPPRSRLQALPWRAVLSIGTVIRLDMSPDSLDALWVERWLQKHIVGRIPGGDHAAQ